MRILVRSAAERAVELAGDRFALRQDLARPIDERRALAAALEPEPGLATAQGDRLLVAAHFIDLLRRVGRAVRPQALKEEGVQEAARLRRDADRRERIEVHQSHFYVLDATRAQGAPLACAALDTARWMAGVVAR